MQEDQPTSQASDTPNPDDSGLRLVFGASGYIGTNLVSELLARRLPVRACCRRPQVLEAHNWQRVEIRSGDALDPTTLPAVLEGVTTAYYLVHSMAAGRSFAHLDRTAASNFAKAAKTAGVRRIIYLGGLIPPDADSEHLLSRLETGEALRESGVPVIELRAGIIVGAGSAAFEVMRDLVFHLPVMLTPRWVHSRSQPIALENLIEYLIQLPNHHESDNQIYDAAGTETLTYAAMMDTMAEVAGIRRPRVVPVPVLTPRLSSYWLKLVTSVPTNIARALIEGLKHDFTANPEPLQRLIPQPLLTFRQSVDAAFAAERAQQVVARWSEGAFPIRKARIDYAYYAKKASGSAISSASAEALWQVISAIGGDNRYYCLNGLWTLRELMDWLVGGNGLKHARRHPQHLRLGDKVDSWEVIGIDPPHRLTLAFGMRAPGAGVLEFEVAPLADGRHRLTATAYWHPAGAMGLLYWFSLQPAHTLIFDGLTREIARRAALLPATAPDTYAP